MIVLDVFTLAKYPFLPEAAEFVRGTKATPHDLLSDPAYERARIAGIERARIGIEKSQIPEARVGGDLDAEVAILSFVVAKMVVACAADLYAARRYALAEAVNAYALMERDEPENVMKVAHFFGFDVRNYGERFHVHFGTYLRNMPTRKDEWKLVNRTMKRGYVELGKREFARLVQEALRRHLEKQLSELEPDDEIKKHLKKETGAIKIAIEAQKSRFEAKSFGAVDINRFPPCMKKILAMAQHGMNVPHAGRFAITSFLHKIGMSSDEILKLFGQSPDFDESKSRYQIEHITGKISSTEYTPPACATMKTYGVCFDPDELCARINHPVSYYTKKRR